MLVVCISVVAFSGPAAAQTATTTSLTTSPSAAILGHPVTLTAMVTPGATGKVTFYDSTTVLGISTLSAGQAAWTTVLLPSGARSLRAYYSGDASHLPSGSAAVPETVSALPSLGLKSLRAYTVGAFPFAVAVGDFNGDGKQDLAVTNEGTANISILLGTGMGTFQPAVNYSVPQPIAIAVGDFNGDGNSDLVVTGSSSWSLLLGNGDGSFQPPATFPTSAVTAVAVGDFNGDGKADLAFGGTGVVVVLLGNGDGTFQAPVSYSTFTPINGGAGPIVYSLALADFNRDGKADLAAGWGGVSILLGNGDGTLQPEVDYPVSFGVSTLVATDLTGAGKLDLVAADQGASLSVLLGNGDGTFQSAVANGYADHIYTLAVGDINGDGKQDVVTVSNAGVAGEVEIFLGNGDGTFQAPSIFSALSTQGMAVGDFDGDGTTDYVLLNFNYGSISVYLGGGMPALSLLISNGNAFTQGQVGAEYTITVSNVGTVASAGSVSVADLLPAQLTATAINGAGWTCVLATLTCTRSDALAAFTSFPPITLTLNVAADAPYSVTNVVNASGGNTAGASASDPTTINIGPPAAPLLSAPANGATGSSRTTVLTWSAASGATSYNVYFGAGASSPPFATSTTALQYTTDHLSPGVTYSWRVSAINSAGSTSSATWSFTTQGTPQPSNAGIFRQGFLWVLDTDGNQQTNIPPDYVYAFGGIPGDIPITGDWNGDGHTKIGIYRPSNGLFILDTNGDGVLDAGDSVFNLHIGMEPGDIPVTGDWNGDGRTKVGYFRQGFLWILDTNGDGLFEQGSDQVSVFGGVAGDLPVVGDWTGTGTSKIGVFRQGFLWVLDANGNGTFDGTGAGEDLVFPYGGIPGDVPVVGDWAGTGIARVGIFRQGFLWALDANGDQQIDAGDYIFAYGGIPGDIPVVGKW